MMVFDWKFHTDEKKIICYFFSCPVTDQQPKNVLPISVATRNLLFIFFFRSVSEAKLEIFNYCVDGNLKYENPET
jgi:hypothetical protein